MINKTYLSFILIISPQPPLNFVPYIHHIMQFTFSRFTFPHLFENLIEFDYIISVGVCVCVCAKPLELKLHHIFRIHISMLLFSSIIYVCEHNFQRFIKIALRRVDNFLVCFIIKMFVCLSQTN